MQSILKVSPLTQKKIQRFKGIKRGYWSFLILSLLLVLSIFAEVFVNSRALLVSYQGQWHFPTYGDVKSGDTFGLGYAHETNYRDLQSQFENEGEGNFVIMPIVPWNPYEQDFSGDFPPTEPSIESQHYLGTDTIGRDIVSRLAYGFRIAMGFALITLVISYAIGVSVGCAMGFFGGKFDLFFQRFIEIWSMVPFLYVIMILVSIMKPSFMLFTLINVMFGWMGMTWYMRTMTYKEKSREYVMAAKALGASNSRIVFHHILPNTMVMIVTLAPFTIVANITALTALDYLGLGLMPPTPSWGELLQQGKSNLDSPWIATSVVTAIVTVLIMVTFIGEGIREAFDPKKHTRYV
ncbi:putative oligopeptide transport system, inner-membrane oligopeptide-binding protein [Aliivibrio wodanis]|uniref:Putative oligopeptide transport system, inner-membrane oligopeptide-binding protein n=1 Tax=Aliivibrio wodanis TaxID=80852 RepID=A0A090IKJ1_9GAMM|nr:putative oligopeptide transport system, inner-membrane oligopeptide-binding protein [Aliivibrio wodanis]VVV03331.1 Inner membrane ABC transporter permease protein YejE [Aliivibrio wodanis]